MRYEKYIIGKLFTSQNGDTDIKKEDISSIGIPVITSGVDKAGILGLTDVKAKIFQKNTITIDMFGNAFFRPFEYKMVTHARVFSMKFIDKEINEKLGLYLITQFHWLSDFFNYSNMCSFNKIKNLTITLPTVDTLDFNSLYSEEGYIPDFEYMEEYIKSIQKVVISDVVKYKDEIIKKTKDIVNKNIEY